jgi:hypothetical protein
MQKWAGGAAGFWESGKLSKFPLAEMERVQENGLCPEPCRCLRAWDVRAMAVD